MWVDNKVMPADSALPPPKKKKKKGTLRSSFATLRESPKIMNLALLVVCYAVSHRLFEFAWKGQLRVLFPTAQQYSGALADVSIYTGTSPRRPTGPPALLPSSPKPPHDLQGSLPVSAVRGGSR